jgi:hypothetical protein
MAVRMPPRHPEAHRVWVAAAFLLGTIARDLLSDPDAAGYALHPPSISPNPGQVLFPFLSHPPQGPLDRQDRHRDASRTLICPNDATPAPWGSLSSCCQCR